MKTLTKFPEETRLYAFDFANQKEIADGSALSAPVAITVLTAQAGGAIVIGDPQIVGTKVQFLLSGGTAGDVFDLLCTTYTNGQAILAARGTLKIDRPE
jgi:hypothetical protein